jgi:CheY-like chemotaxis protein
MILFFDDEPVHMELWREELEREFGEVRMITMAGELLSFLEEDPPPSLDLFVFESMAPTPPSFDDARTEYGTRTGVSLFDLFRARYPEVPAILLTNVRDDPLLRRFNDPARRLGSGRKRDLGPKNLVKLARALGVKAEP